MTRYAFLGPLGTFTEEALHSVVPDAGSTFLPESSISGVVEAVARGDADVGCVPIENSIEGSVNVTLDTLAFGPAGLVIAAEIVRPIRHALLALDATTTPTDVLSHPHATAQCREYLHRTYPDARIHAANSTAEAASDIADRGDPAWVAIGTTLAAELYDLTVRATDIEDREDNASRFVMIAREGPPPSGADRTSIVCFIEKDRPGSLLAILHEFGDRGINLTKLESRPTKERLGEYCFFIDMEGHADEPPVRYAIESLRTKILEVKVLGSYPRAADA